MYVASGWLRRYSAIETRSIFPMGFYYVHTAACAIPISKRAKENNPARWLSWGSFLPPSSFQIVIGQQKSASGPGLALHSPVPRRDKRLESNTISVIKSRGRVMHAQGMCCTSLHWLQSHAVFWRFSCLVLSTNFMVCGEINKWTQMRAAND